MIGDTSYDKDGVRAASVFVEMTDQIYKKGKTLSEHLADLYAKVKTTTTTTVFEKMNGTRMRWCINIITVCSMDITRWQLAIISATIL